MAAEELIKGTEKARLGSCRAYYMLFDGATVPALEDIMKEENLLGHSKGGATVDYTPTFLEERDDHGLVIKSALTEEAAKASLGLFTWSARSLAVLGPTTRVTEANGVRTAKIGGIKNNDGKKYVILLYHEDKADGDCWIIIVGKNRNGFSITFKNDNATTLNPEIHAEPMDSEGTLIEYNEKIVDATATETKTEGEGEGEG